MAFVYSNWYIVMALLVVAIVALIVTFVLMDKKDKVLIQEFVKSSSQPETNEAEVESTAAEANQEQKE